MANVLSILLMLGILSVLIIVHEFGHFFVARFFGFQTPIFGFGLPFGPSWTLGKKWDTQFKIHLLMLGGYVAIPELGDESALAHEAYGVPLKPFVKFPIWQRALVAVAGVTMNVIFAYVVMVTMVAMLGLPVPKVYVDKLVETIPYAREAGVKVNDRINTIDGTKISTSDQVITYLGGHKNQTVTLGILREPLELKGTPEGEEKAEKVELQAKVSPKGQLGMQLVSPRLKQDNMSPIDIAADAFTELCDLTNQMVSTLSRMMYQIAFGWMEHHDKNAPPQAGLGDLHGVFVVIKWGAELAQENWTQLFMFTALISMDLAIVNLLPIPALDGGHLFFMLLEALRGKPMEEKLHGELVKWGFISLLALMAIIMVNDIRALLTGELDVKKHKGQKDEKKIEKKSEAPPDADPGTGTTTGTSTGATTALPSGTEAPNHKPGDSILDDPEAEVGPESDGKTDVTPATSTPATDSVPAPKKK